MTKKQLQKVVERNAKLLSKLKKSIEQMEREYGKFIVDSKGSERRVEKVYQESLRNPNMERILFVPDIHIPDHNKEAVKTVLDFISDFRPTHIYLLGDLLNFSKAGDFLIVDGECPTLEQEITEGRAFLYDLRQKSPESKITYLFGNHEARLEKFLAKTGDVLTGLVSVDKLLGLKDLDIDWIPYHEVKRKGSLIIEHGKIVRSKAGASAHAQLDKFGKSGISGHTHRFGFVARNFGGDVKWWLESGTLSNLTPTPHWGPSVQDWQTGFAVGIYDRKEDVVYPMPILMQNNKFWFGDKIYGK